MGFEKRDYLLKLVTKLEQTSNPPPSSSPVPQRSDGKPSVYSDPSTLKLEEKRSPYSTLESAHDAAIPNVYSNLESPEAKAKPSAYSNGESLNLGAKPSAYSNGESLNLEAKPSAYSKVASTGADGRLVTQSNESIAAVTRPSGMPALNESKSIGSRDTPPPSSPKPREPEKDHPRPVKRYPDSLSSDPKVAALLKSQQVEDQKLAEIRYDLDAIEGLKSPAGSSDNLARKKALEAALQSQLKKVQSINQELEKATRFVTQTLRPEYEGEDHKLGKWRAEPRKQRASETKEQYDDYLKKLDALSELDVRVTKYYGDAERKASEVQFDQQGKAVGSGGPIAGKNAGYVMDRTGRMHQFRENAPPQKTGQQVTSPVTGKPLDKDTTVHHSSILGGKEVAAAGEVRFNSEGHIAEISNKSGHYKPGAAQMIQLLEELARTGPLLDQQYVMVGPDGKARPINDKVRQIWQSLYDLALRIEDKRRKGQAIEEKEKHAMEQAEKALKELGVAPANKYRNVNVKFLDSAANKKGREIASGEGFKTSTAEKFLQSGGGYVPKKTTGQFGSQTDDESQADKKARVLSDLKKPQSAAKLDKEAEDRLSRIIEETRRELREVEGKLKSLENDRTNFAQLQLAKLKVRQKLLQSRLSDFIKPGLTNDELDKILGDLNKLKSNDRK